MHEEETMLKQLLFVMIKVAACLEPDESSSVLAQVKCNRTIYSHVDGRQRRLDTSREQPEEMSSSVEKESPHEEEILVLTSIFSEDLVMSTESTFDVIIRFDSLANPIRLVHEESQRSSQLAHLPPITLRVSLPATYPHQTPPEYCLSCDYLPHDHLAAFATHMDAMWKPHEVIVYLWAAFLRESFDDVDQQLRLPSNEASPTDRRYTSNYHTIGSQRVYEQLIDYNRAQDLRVFEQTYHDCPIW